VEREAGPMSIKDRIIVTVVLTFIACVILHGLSKGNIGGAIMLGGTTHLMIWAMYGKELKL
jgi:hypothetical protein